jgi:SM-20-related protein
LVSGETRLTKIELNPNLDWDTMREHYSVKNRLQIRNFLTEASAERLLHCLESETKWYLAYLDSEPKLVSYQALEKKTPQEYRQLQQRLAKVANEQPFHYLYDCYPLLQAYKENWEPELFINRWLEFINTDTVLTPIRRLTEQTDIIRADSQATRYGPNQYLTRHTDNVPSEGRRVAYVFNLTQSWDPNWGGYLQFFDQDKNLSDGFRPEFNTLNLFTVPQDHSVACISQFAKRYRYTLVGWFRAADQ